MGEKKWFTWAINVATVVMFLCVVFVTGMVIRRQFFEARPASGGFGLVVPVDGWDAVSSGGHRVGSADAPVTVVEFSDFQCPACREWATGARDMLRRRFPDEVALVFRHWPLERHDWAYEAARASECAAEQGFFEAVRATLFSQQDSIGRKSFRDFATEAGVPDVERFAACASESGPVEAIEADIEAVRGIRGRGTPTIVINGSYYPAIGSDSARLDSLVRSLLER